MVDEVVEEQVEAAKEERVVTEEVEATTGSKERWIDMVEEEAASTTMESTTLPAEKEVRAGEMEVQETLAEEVDNRDVIFESEDVERTGDRIESMKISCDENKKMKTPRNSRRGERGGRGGRGRRGGRLP